jgi:hypothetical protein
MNLIYEKQEDAPGRRMCGAAALCMVYRSFGGVVTQQDVWPAISRPNFGGEPRAHSFLLGADALERGYAALTIQARDPWRALELAAAHDIRTIVNHRLSVTSGAGHFAVVVAVDDDAVVVHDPQVGPNRRIGRAEFLELWRADWSGRWRSEVTGNVLVAFAADLGDACVCRSCGASSPHSIRCAACARTAPLQPAAVLGCVDAACGARVWEQIFCPYCDAACRTLGSAAGSAA